jgi:hypothetical protein
MITYRVLPEQRLVVAWHRGVASLSEFTRHVEARMADPSYSAAYDMLTDVSGLERHYTSEDLRQMADFARRFYASSGKGRKHAIVASGDAAFGLSRMFEMLSEPGTVVEVRVFRTQAKALEWLGRDPGAIPEPE